MNNKLNEAEALFAEGKIEEAEKYFLFEAENGTCKKEAYNNLGVIAFQKDDREKAIDYFTRSLEIDSLYKDAVLNYTSLLRELNQIHIAVPLLEKIAETKPHDEDINHLLEEIQSTHKSRQKLAILCLPRYETFLEDITNHLKSRYEVRTCYTYNDQEMVSSVEWADIVWLEFANDISVYNKHEQLVKLGFTNVFIYPGGMFEWICLQDIYGEENFPTTKKELDILKFKAKSILNKLYLQN